MNGRLFTFWEVVKLSEEKFIQAVKNKSISEIQSIPKSDLHSHAGRGGSITYIEQWANVKIIHPQNHLTL